MVERALLSVECFMEQMSDEEVRSLFEQRKELDAIFAQKVLGGDREGAIDCQERAESIRRELEQAGRFSWIVRLRDDGSN